MIYRHIAIAIHLQRHWSAIISMAVIYYTTQHLRDFRDPTRDFRDPTRVVSSLGEIVARAHMTAETSLLTIISLLC